MKDRILEIDVNAGNVYINERHIDLSPQAKALLEEALDHVESIIEHLEM